MQAQDTRQPTKKPFRICNHPGCSALVLSGYCDVHKALRGAWVKNRYTPRLTGRILQRERDRLFREQPLCAECLRHGRTTPATERDHIISLAEGGTDTRENTQGLCKRCHDAKTHREAARGRHHKG